MYRERLKQGELKSEPQLVVQKAPFLSQLWLVSLFRKGIDLLQQQLLGSSPKHCHAGKDSGASPREHGWRQLCYTSPGDITLPTHHHNILDLVFFLFLGECSILHIPSRHLYYLNYFPELQGVVGTNASIFLSPSKANDWFLNSSLVNVLCSGSLI